MSERALGKLTSTFVVSLVLLLGAVPLAFADDCPGGVLPAGTGQDIVISTPCSVKGDVSNGKYSYGNVNIINGGTLTFSDAKIDFWSSGILVENGGTLAAGTPDAPIGTNRGVVTIHLYGADQGNNGKGIECKSDQKSQCGIPDDVWNHDDTSKLCFFGNGDNCDGGVLDYFYKYQPLMFDGGDTNAYFGYKVLGVGYGGTLKLFGKKGVDYSIPVNQPWNSGRSWAHLNSSVPDAKNPKQLVLDRQVFWEVGDHIVLTTTDYLPGHSEELTVTQNVRGTVSTITVAEDIKYPHNGKIYAYGNRVQAGIGPDPDPNLDPTQDPKKRYVETRAAVGLLTHHIRIVSEGDQLDDPFHEESTHYFFGGHTVFRQGFRQVQIRGVEFKQMGQGGRMMHYPVHFHMARRVMPDTFVSDSSINESMTRWVTIHGTQGVTIARNVGWKSIGHGFFLEDGVEIDNKFYSNLGVFARAAVVASDPANEKYNPRHVPGIFAAAYSVPDKVPEQTDYEHPTGFWIMNGWNDFQYNHIAGAGTCGVCYWMLPAFISGDSSTQKWEGYAAEQSGGHMAGTTPLKKFRGNSCSTAMTSFTVVGNTAPCFGVAPDGSGDPSLMPVPPVPPPPSVETTSTASNMPGMYPEGAMYPNIVGALGHVTTTCPNDSDCSGVKEPCSYNYLENCGTIVIDHFTSSFSWAQINVSSVWLRPQWYLYINSALTDVQGPGLTMVTGGGYTESDSVPGHWALAKKDIFVGNTQDNSSLFASSYGPVRPGSNTACARRGKDFVQRNCLVREGSSDGKEETVSVQTSPFNNFQRLLNIYDGPVYQASNAYLDIKPAVIDSKTANCTGNASTGGICDDSYGVNSHADGLPKDHNGVCYMPNAAIGWKQPNGFYYPPAFHSKGLYFNNVDIRHFVVEPILQSGTYLQDDGLTFQRYCTWTRSQFGGGKNGLFGSFTDIDRQTELNDDDGTLTGLKSTNPTLLAGTISVNQDAFFKVPVETPECASDTHDPQVPATDPPATADTSPYDYVTTVVYPYCGKCGFSQIWWQNCEDQNCSGVPLYREFINQNEKGTQPFIRMAGESTGQRSALTPNNGSFYVDTTYTVASKGDFAHTNHFEAGKDYYMFFLFAKPSTRQKYSIYVGPGFDTSSVKAVRLVKHGNDDNHDISFTDVPTLPTTWSVAYNDNDPTHIKDVLYMDINMNFSDFQNGYKTEKQNRCQPQNFCTMKGSSCGCKLSPQDPLYQDCQDVCVSGADPYCPNGVCAGWASKDPDCPDGGCYGFRFTMGTGFTEGPKPNLPPTPTCYDTSPGGPWNQQFTRRDQNGQQCYYQTPPTIKTCSLTK